MSFSKTLFSFSLLLLQISASLIFPRCTPSSTFNLQAVSSDPAINDVVVTITGDALFLNSTNPTFTTFYKNDTNHLFAYVNEVNNGGSDNELRSVFAFSDGPTFTLEPEEGQVVYRADYIASDVAFPKPEGTLGFIPKGDDGTALGGWWACPYITSSGSYWALMNGVPKFDGTYNFGVGAETCQEIELQIKPLENIEC